MIEQRASLRRHDLIRIDAAAWASEGAARPEIGGDPLLAGWAPGWPLVARRRSAADRAGSVAAGLPLPPCRGKRRIAFAFAAATITAIEPPPALDRVLASAPSAWHATIHAILALAGDHAVSPRVFGSFAWASLTGLPYIGPGSDLDLLWPHAPGIEAILAALPAIEQAAPGKLDGEVVRFRDGGAVNWRELASAGEVLVKTIEGVALEDARDYLQGG